VTTTTPPAPSYRVGLIVPSSNTTMETEIPDLLRRRAEVAPNSSPSTPRGCACRKSTPTNYASWGR